MCGIAGVIGQNFSTEIAKNMLNTMVRRGPDEQGVYTNDDVMLLHRRLSIIDPEGGKQPLTIRVGAETYTIVYNGELYNIEEVRRELTAMGHTFSGRCDTEVVLRAYIAWKEKALHKLNGIFGFAVWEEKSRRMFLARDRIGVKPLFYTCANNVFIFASEIKTILAHPCVEPVIDAEGVAQILYLGPGRKPGSGVFKRIEELKPGHYAVWERDGLKVCRYWKLSDREHIEDFRTTADHVRYLVTDAIKRQMISDVPLGTFLSGGLDSSLISAVCAEELRKKGEKLQTFSVDYLNNDKYFVPGKFQPNSDDAYIDIMQKSIQSKHKTTVLTVDTLASALEDATRARDLPGMADVDFSLLAFCKEIRKDVKMALSGECADEIFGGYPWYRDPEIRALEGFPWAQNTDYRESLCNPAIRVNAREYVNDLYIDTLRDTDVLPGVSALERRMKEMVVLNQTWFMQTLLDRKDRMSMWCSLEVRVPFCDYRIAEYLYGVPWEMKDHQGREKGLLRYAMRGILPDDVLWRKKSPYPKTYDPSYLTLMQQQLRRVLQDPTAPIHKIIDTNAVNKILTEEQIWPWYGQLMKQPQTIAYMLQIDCWMRQNNVDIA